MEAVHGLDGKVMVIKLRTSVGIVRIFDPRIPSQKNILQEHVSAFFKGRVVLSVLPSLSLQLTDDLQY